MISGSADWNPSWLIIQILNGILPYGYKGMRICVYGGVCLCEWEFDMVFKNSLFFFLDFLKCNFDIYELQCW